MKKLSNLIYVMLFGAFLSFSTPVLAQDEDDNDDTRTERRDKDRDDRNDDDDNTAGDKDDDDGNYGWIGLLGLAGLLGLRKKAETKTVHTDTVYRPHDTTGRTDNPNRTV